VNLITSESKIIRKNKLVTKEYSIDWLLSVARPEKKATIRNGIMFQSRFPVIQKNRKKRRN
jgi:hypothetical protein